MLNKLLAETLDSYRSEHLRVLQNFNLTSLLPVADVLGNSLANDSSLVYVCGNGGSAALSQHFAIDLGLGTHKSGKKACRIIDLTSNTAVLTATANDTGYEKVFSSQVDFYGRPGDLLIAISSSGNSQNVINAVRKAKELEIVSVGLTGFDGGALRGLVDYSIHVETKVGKYGLVEDLHSFVLHALTHLLQLKGNRIP